MITLGKTYISPVGTSLLVNFAKEYGSKYSVKYGNVEAWARIPPDDDRNRPPNGTICRTLEDKEFIQDMVSFIMDKKEKSCAEINGLMNISSIFNHAPRDVEVVLIYTNSCNTIVVKTAVKSALEKLGYRSVVEECLTGISSVDEFDTGLLEVLDKVSSIIRDRKKKKWRVYINATPGFKAETTFIVLISLLLGADGVVYIHESFNKPVLLPSIPLSVRKEEIKQLIDIFGGEEKLHINAIYSSIGYEGYLDLLEKGLIVNRQNEVFVRPWLKALLEIID